MTLSAAGQAEALRRRLLPLLAQLDSHRQACRRRLLEQWGLLGAVVAGLVAVQLPSGEKQPSMATVIVCVVGLFVAFWLHRRQRGLGAEIFKKRMIPGILRLLEPRLVYVPAAGISREEFCKSGLFPRPDRYASKDLFVGRIDGKKARFSLVHAEEKRERRVHDGNGRTRTETYYQTIFQGVLFIAESPRRFSEDLYLFSGGLHPRNRIHTEHPEFNRLFKVVGRNLQEAFYLLTPDFMERLLALRRQLNKPFQAAFVEGRIHIAFPGSFQLFDPPLSRSWVDPRVFNELFLTLGFFIGVPERLQLAPPAASGAYRS